MKYVVNEIWNKICHNYYERPDEYLPEYDPNLTYQEFLLIYNVRFYTGDFHPDYFDTNDFSDGKDEWKKYYVGHLYNPMVIDKPWDQAIVNKANVKISFVKDEQGYLKNWKDYSPYKELYIEEQAKMEKNINNKSNDLKTNESKKESLLGNRIQARRKELNLTLRELSEKCSLSPQLISDYENGRKEPGIQNLKSLCQGLDINPAYILMDEYNYNNYKTNTYGYVFGCYMEAIRSSINDELIIDKEKRTVEIKIKDEILVNTFIQIKDFLQNEALFEIMKNFNTYLLSDKEIKKEIN